MLKIGEFSKLSLTTVKALRYYEKEGLLIPTYVDEMTGYRFYETKQLEELSRIKSLRQIGFSIVEIKQIHSGRQLTDVLLTKRTELEKLTNDISYQLKTINYMLEDKNMKYQVVMKKLPKCVVYYEERRLKNYSEVSNLVLESGAECLRLNPNLECVKPDYCFCEYLDGEYRKKDILVRYSQAVVKKGIENERIHFKELEEKDVICIYHNGDYNKFGDAYSFILNYAKENDYEMTGFMREVYIDGIWNKENPEDYLTEIQMPVRKK
jgi:Predicted transcriptional regulators